MASKHQTKADYWKDFCCGCSLETWRCIAFILTCINVPILLCTVVISTVWFNQRLHYSPEEHISSTCFPHQEGAPCQGTIKTDSDVPLCCNGSMMLSKTLESLATDSYRQLQLPYLSGHTEHCISTPGKKPAARVVGITDGSASTLQWNHTTKDSFLHDIKYVLGRFIVLKTGYYYVYSQISFLEDQAQSDDVTLSHSVYRQGPITKEKLLESVRAQCQLQTKSSNSSKFVGAVFYMREGEELMVEVSDFTRVSNTPHANFFGLHLI